MTEARDRLEQEEAPRVVVRDRRRVDPESGAVRTPDPAPEHEAGQPADAPAGQPAAFDEAAAGEAAAGGEATASDATAAVQALLDERTADLQRLKAEFDNYRRRVERDRVAVIEQATAAVLANLLPVLDDIDRAREHGELTGGFKSVAESLESTLGKLGLQRSGAPGEPFDPARHEAVTHQHSLDVTEPTCVAVLRPGYTFADRLVRPAMVAVAEPPEPDAPPSDTPTAAGE